MKKCMIAAGLALAAATVASADVKFDFAGPFVFGPSANVSLATTPISGTLESVLVSFDFSGALGASWASDFVVAIEGIAWGGFNTNFGNIDQGALVGIPDTGNAGFYSGSGDVVSNAPVFTGGASKFTVGNGWTGTTGGMTIANLSITLKGVDKVPAPGAMALLGLAGFAARRRRA